MALVKWIRKAVEVLVDPDKSERIDLLAQSIQRQLALEKKRFSLDAFLKDRDDSPGDVCEATERVYRTILAKGWSDGRLTADERKTTEWVAPVLQLAPARVRTINEEFARDRFALALAKAMEDGVLSAQEEEELRQISEAAGCTVAEFTQRFFRTESERFLRGVFLASIADSILTRTEWENLLITSRRLGLSQDKLLNAIHLQARQFVEHVLADAKTDECLSQQEEETLCWLLGTLQLPSDFANYAKREIALMRLMTDVGSGKLPVEPPPPQVALRAGEMVHLHAEATWRIARILKSGTQTVDHRGTLTLTDHRLIFTSPTKSQSVNYGSVIGHTGGPGWIEIQAQGKTASRFYLSGNSPLPNAIFRIAVAKANQTMVENRAGKHSRHIPRDVRQRVWQRYAGKCAECDAGDYLEFDHVIPVAKGGSNSDANVQLLCRRCNLKKSDHI